MGLGACSSFLWAAGADQSSASFKFLNFNILNCRPFGPEEDFLGYHEDYDDFTMRMDFLVEEIRRLNPDFMSLQEMTRCWFFNERKWLEVDRLIAQKTGYQHVFWRSEGPRGLWEEGIAFYWKPDRVRFEDIECAHLKTAHYTGPMKIVKSLCRGRATLADGRSFFIYQTHLDTQRKYSEPQTREILSTIARDHPDEPILFSGDFNNGPQSPSIAMVKDWGFDEIIGDHVDFIFSKNLGALSPAKVIDFRGAYLSDHNGLWLEIK